MPDQNIVITGMDTAVTTRSEAGTPTGYATLTATNGSVKGTAGDDKATLATLLIDKDHNINLGDGNDIFVFRNDAQGSYGSINGIVTGGDGIDHVYLGGQLSDYIFSIRSTGGIKIHYIPDGDDGAAVTFNGWELFTFRSVDTNGVNHEDITYSYNQLYSLIQNANPSDTPAL